MKWEAGPDLADAGVALGRLTIVMLVLIAATVFAAHAAGAQTEGLSLASLTDALDKAGYSLTGGRDTTALSPKAGLWVDVQYQAESARYRGARQLHVSLASEEGVPLADLKVQRLMALVEFKISGDLPVGAPFQWPEPARSPVKTTLTPHIGNTVTAVSSIVGVPRLTTQELLEAIDTAWKSVDTYAKRFGPKLEQVDGRSSESIKISDRQVLAYPDGRSIERLAYHWGWYQTPWGGGSGGWIVYADFGRYQGLLTQGMFPTSPQQNFFSVSVYVKGLVANPAQWIDQYGPRYKWLRFLPGPDASIQCIGRVDLTSRTTVADVKSQILAFIRRVEQLERDVRNGILPPKPRDPVAGK